MLRRLTKTGVACALHWTGAAGWISALSGSKKTPLIIGYHRVVEDFAASARNSIPPMLISRRTLELQLDWIGRRFRLISLDDLGQRLENGDPFNKPVAAVTFDDGYGDVYYNAFPLLQRKGIPAAVFVVTDLVGTSQAHLHDKLYLLLGHFFSTRRSPPRDLIPLLAALGIWSSGMGKASSASMNPYGALRTLLAALSQAEIQRLVGALESEVKMDKRAVQTLYPLSWEMLTEMQSAGVTIGSHTKTHAWLTREDPQKMMDEIAGSKQELERRLGITTQHFAYPDGRFNPAVVSAVADAGYRFGYTSCRHRDPHYPFLTLPRHIFWEKSCLDALGRFSPTILSCQVNGVFDWRDRCRQDHGESVPYAVPSVRGVAP